MLGWIVFLVLVLVLVMEIIRAIRTGEVRVKGKESVIRRSEYPLWFNFMIGLYVLVAAVGLDFAFEIGLLMKLIHLTL